MKRRLRAAATSLALILVVALGLRVLFLVRFVAHNSHHALGITPFLFESGNIAVSLAGGQGFSSPFHAPTGPTAWMTPVYPLLLAGIFRLSGSYTFAAYLAAALMNILFATLVCIPVYYAARRIGGAGLGAGAAWLWAIFPNAILLTFQSMWAECLTALLAATVLWATLAVEGSRRLRDWCGYGLLWGVLLMTDPTVSSVLPFLLAWLIYRDWRKRQVRLRGALARPALALGVAILCCVPWTIRNYQVFHALVPLQSVLGLQLWMGNNPQATPVWHGRLHPINNSAQRAEYVRMGEIAYMHRKLGQALRFMASHPGRVAYLSARRFLALWAGGTPYPLRAFLANRSLWFRYVLLFNLLAGLGTLAGIVILFRRRSPYALCVAVFPVVFPWAFYLTLAMPRYRLPIDPMVMLLSAVTLGTLFHLMKGKSRAETVLPGTRAGRRRARAGKPV